MSAAQKIEVEAAIALLQTALQGKSGWDRQVLDATAKLTAGVYR